MFIIFYSKLLSIASGIVSPFSCAWRNMTISSSVSVMGLVAALAARCFSTSPKICCLPVGNIRVPGEFWRIWLSESKSFARWLAGHSSKESMHITVSWEIISCKNSTISASASLWRPITLLLSRKAFAIACGILLPPPATCFNTEPRISARDCSSL